MHAVTGPVGHASCTVRVNEKPEWCTQEFWQTLNHAAQDELQEVDEKIGAYVVDEEPVNPSPHHFYREHIEVTPGAHYVTLGADENGLNKIDETDDHGPYCDILFPDDTSKMIREEPAPADYTALQEELTREGLIDVPSQQLILA